MRGVKTGNRLSPLVRAAVAACAVGALAACGKVEPFDYTAIHEIPPGPGLISGEDGEFVLIGPDRESPAE